MTNLPTPPRVLSLALLSLCLSAPLASSAKTPNTPAQLQCDKDGRLQACEDAPAQAQQPRKAAAFKAQATDTNAESDKPVKKSKKKSKKAKKKAKPSVAE